MAGQDNPLYAAINANLAQFAADSRAQPPWHDAWFRLRPDSSEEEQLAVYQAIRDAGSLPEEAGFYLVSWQIDAITLHDAEEELRELEERLEEIRQQHGLEEDEFWSPGEGPPEYDQVQQQLHAAWDALYARKLDEFGEHAMALLLRSDRERYSQLSDAGRQFFHGLDHSGDDEDTDWLDDLLDAVAACVEPESPMGPLRLCAHNEEGFWEVTIYPTPVELLGGAHDGEVVVPGFSLDLEDLRAAFTSIAAFGWNALGLNDPEGPCISVEGVYQGREVFLQVLAQAPEDEEPGLKLDTTRRPRP